MHPVIEKEGPIVGQRQWSRIFACIYVCTCCRQDSDRLGRAFFQIPGFAENRPRQKVKRNRRCAQLVSMNQSIRVHRARRRSFRREIKLENGMRVIIGCLGEDGWARL